MRLSFKKFEIAIILVNNNNNNNNIGVSNAEIILKVEHPMPRKCLRQQSEKYSL